MTRLIFTVFSLFAFCTSVSAQNPVLVDKESRISISGTSNLHDWKEAAEEFSIDMKLSTDGASMPVIDMVIFKCKAASITSDNSIMTNKTHNALNFPHLFVIFLFFFHCLPCEHYTAINYFRKKVI